MLEFIRRFSSEHTTMVCGHYKPSPLFLFHAFIYSLPLSSFSTHITLLPAFRSSHFAILMCTLLFGGGLGKPVIFCMLEFLIYVNDTIKFFLRFFFPLGAVFKIHPWCFMYIWTFDFNCCVAFHILWHSLSFTFCSPIMRAALLPAPCYHKQLCDV